MKFKNQISMEALIKICTVVCINVFMNVYMYVGMYWSLYVFDMHSPYLSAVDHVGDEFFLFFQQHIGGPQSPDKKIQ